MKHRFTFIAALTLAAAVPLQAASPRLPRTTVKRALPAQLDKVDKPAALFPNDKEGSILIPREDEEVLKPGAFSSRDLRVLQEAKDMPLGRLTKLLQVYERQGNVGMVDGLSRVVLQRDSRNAEALRMLESTNPTEETRSAGYLEELASKVMAGETVNDVDSVILQANTLLFEQNADEARKLLEKLRSNQFKGDVFFQGLHDLAYAYAECHAYDTAEKLYREIAEDSRFSMLERKDAELALPSIVIKKRIYSIRQESGKDYSALARRAVALHEELPNSYEATTFLIEALDRAKMYDEAITLLQRMKLKAASDPAWPWEPTLAYAYYVARRYDEADALFNSILNNTGFDKPIKVDAETMIIEIAVGREITAGIQALQNGDAVTAKAILKRLEANYPQHEDTLGYKAIYMAKTGDSSAAIAMLQAKKQELQSRGFAFNQQDALADVYYERKEFDKAADEIQQILNDPRYDVDAKAAATKQLIVTQIGKILHEGDQALRDADRAKAKDCLARAKAIDPQSIEVRIFEAEVTLAYASTTAQSKCARDQLLELRGKWKTGPFPGTIALADAYAQSGDWEKGDQTYLEAIKQPGALPLDVWNATWQRRMLIPWTKPHSHFQASVNGGEEGSVFSTASETWSGWTQDDWRFGTFTNTDRIKTNSSSIFGARSAERYEGGAIAQKKWGSGYFTEGRVGGATDNVVYGVKVGKLAFQSLGWSLAWDGNARNTESLALQALNGRQDTVTLNVGGLFANRFQLNSNLYYQRSHIKGDNLANGYGASVQLDYVLQQETKTKPQLSIGYNGDYHRQNLSSTLPSGIQEEIRRAELTPVQLRREQAINRGAGGDASTRMLNALIDSETHRHGADFRISKNFTDWSAYSSVGTYYSVDDKLAGFTLAAGLEYWATENAMFYLDATLDTSGQAANTDEIVYQTNLGGMVKF